MTNLPEKPAELDKIARMLNRTWHHFGIDSVGSGYGRISSNDAKDNRWMLFVYISPDNFERAERMIPQSHEEFDVAIKVTPSCMLS